MYNWFETVIKYDKTGDDGIVKTVAEKYLVDALSFTEAEARITKEMQPYISGEFVVASVNRRKIAELFDSVDASADRWFKSKVNFISLDENHGVEKRVSNTMYVKANTIKEALNTLIEKLKGTLSDYEIVSISETLIMDVYNYVPVDGVTPVSEKEN